MADRDRERERRAQAELARDPDPSAVQLFYRLGLRAHTGAEWSIRVHDRALGRDLIVDGDALGLDKSWLVGSCSLEAEVTRPRIRLRLA